MVNCKIFFNSLKEEGIDFFTGVPDSLFKDICAYIAENMPSQKNIIAANEGNAVALAAGYHLATGKIGFVYMQNSGQGNAVNPLVSLADPEVYGIPMLLMIGWRGEPGIKDEPQHIKQGKITLDILRTLGIPYKILPTSDIEARKVLKKAIIHSRSKKVPYALVVKKNTFDRYNLKAKQTKTQYNLSREDAIKTIIDNFNEKDSIVSTTGMASRELFEYRDKLKQGHSHDFLTVGSMGHSSSIALGIALSRPDKQIFCLDGDGALIMHMGSLAVIGSSAPKNLKHIVINNEAHDSVGGQKTAAFSMLIPNIALSCGYKSVFQAKTRKEVEKKLLLLKLAQGPALLEIKVKKGSRSDLGRPTITPKEGKELFMNFLTQKTSSTNKSADQLKNFLVENKAKSIFLVTGNNSYGLSGAKEIFGELLSKYDLTKFSDFSVNPNTKDLKRGLALFKKGNYDAVIAICGGSVIDMAKLINIFSVHKYDPTTYIKGENQIKTNGKPLLAIPTTAGSGSEATHFAVIYLNKVKYSVTHKYLLPDHSIVDPVFTMNLSKQITASSGMDALCQAIESYWSVNSTDISKQYSKKAIRLALNNLGNAVNKPSLKSRRGILQAANLAGKAINITKTTAPHAISYVFTSNFNVSHGHAVALTLGKILKHNSEVNDTDVADKRGKKYVKKTIRELCSFLGVSGPAKADKKLEDLMKSVGLKTKLKDLGVKKKNLKMIINSVNSERLKNNPRLITKEKLNEILMSIL